MYILTLCMYITTDNTSYVQCQIQSDQIPNLMIYEYNIIIVFSVRDSKFHGAWVQISVCKFCVFFQCLCTRAYHFISRLPRAGHPTFNYDLLLAGDSEGTFDTWDSVGSKSKIGSGVLSSGVSEVVVVGLTALFNPKVAFKLHKSS